MHTVIEQRAASDAVDVARAKWQRAGDAWNAITWVIARDPTVGEALTESGKSRSLTLHGARSIGLPSVTVVYEIQEPFVIVHEALFEDAPYGPAGNA